LQTQTRPDGADDSGSCLITSNRVSDAKKDFDRKAFSAVILEPHDTYLATREDSLRGRGDDWSKSHETFIGVRRSQPIVRFKADSCPVEAHAGVARVALQRIGRREQGLEGGDDLVDRVAGEGPPTLCQQPKLAVRSIEREGGIMAYQDHARPLGDVRVIRDVEQDSAERAPPDPFVEHRNEMLIRDRGGRRENLRGQSPDSAHIAADAAVRRP
jgi:hypothetical protein